MYLAIRVDAIEAFSCLSYRTKKLRIWVIFFFTEKFFGYFFWNFSFCFLIGWKQNCSFCYLTTASDSSWNFRSRFIIWNSEIMRENMFFWALKIEKKTKKTFILKKNPFPWGIAENLRRCFLFLVVESFEQNKNEKKAWERTFFYFWKSDISIFELSLRFERMLSYD